MGLIGTEWEGEYHGHKVEVVRNEIGRGFRIVWDGTVVAKKAFSLFGLGKLQGTVDLDGRSAPIHLKIGLFGGGIDGACNVTVDGTDIPMRKTR